MCRVMVQNLQASIVPNLPLPPPMVESDPSLAVMLGLEASVTRTATMNLASLADDSGEATPRVD